MDTNTVKDILKDYISSERDNHHRDLTEKELGIVHGIEYALSLLENRPAVYLQKDRTYSEHDKKKFPEYFL